MKESNFQGKIRRAMIQTGWRVFNVHGHQMQEPGWPDLMGWHRQGFIGLELKILEGRLRPSQINILNDLRARGFVATCLRWFPDHLETDDGDSLEWSGDSLQLHRWLVSLPAESTPLGS